MATQLTVLERYDNAQMGLHFEAGQVVTVEDALAEWLQRDSPGAFALYVEPVKALDAPPVDKMLHKPRAKK